MESDLKILQTVGPGDIINRKDVQQSIMTEGQHICMVGNQNN